MSEIAKSNHEITNYNSGEITAMNEQFIKKFLSVEPEANEIKVNEFQNNSLYIPISMIEDKLDEVFLGLWEVKDFKYQTVANEIIGSVQLRVFHPVYKTWIERTGAGAVMVQMKSKNNGGDGSITNIDNKIPNTLVKDFPHLKAECIKNAAKSLGKWFGRDLNRKEEMRGHYETLYTNDCEFQLKKDEIMPKLMNCNNIDEIKMLWDTLEDEEQGNTKIKKLFTARRTELKIGLK